MSPAEQLTPTDYAADAVEISFCAAGLALILWLALSRSGRARLQIRLAEWRLPWIDFSCFLCFGFVGFVVATGISGFVVRHWSLGSDAAVLFSPVAVDGGFLLGLAGFYLMYAGRDESPLAHVSAPFALESGVATFLIATPVLFAALWASEFALKSMGIPIEKQAVVDMFEGMRSLPMKWAFVAFASTIVPAAEELVFRAGLFRYFRTRMPRWIAVLATSLLFGAAHVAWGGQMAGLVSALPLVVLAVIYCLAYERTGSIGTTIVAHSLFNLNTTILILLGVGS